MTLYILHRVNATVLTIRICLTFLCRSNPEKGPGFDPLLLCLSELIGPIKRVAGPLCSVQYCTYYTVRVVHLHIWSKWCSNIDCMVVQYRIQINTSILWRGPKISVKYQFNLCMIWRENPPMKYCEKYAKICTNKSVFSQPLQYCICSHNIKFFLYTVPKITWIFACHGWSRCIGICWFMGQIFVYKCQT